MKRLSAPRISCWVFVALFPVWIPPDATASEALAKITVEAGETLRINTPVSISLESLPIPLDSGLRLEELKGSQRVAVPSQIEPGHTPRLWWILSEETPPQERREFEVVQGSHVQEQAVRVAKDGAALRILLGKERVLQYNHAPVPPPEGAGAEYARSGFIHPLWSPGGEELTRIHPPDHIHHMGIWNPWTKTLFEGREVDFWNLGEGRGTVRFVQFASTISGPVFGGFRAVHEHVDRSAPGGEKVALNEEWDVRVWNLGAGKKGGWLLDFTTTQCCASSSSILLQKYRYGGLGFRATELWEEGSCLTSEGKTRKDGHGTRARWCIVSGPTAKGQAGVLFMSNPQNHEHPEPMRIWPEGDVFFNFCPVQSGDWTMEPGNDYVLRYRLYVFHGALSPEEADRLWQDFGNPPGSTMKRVRKTGEQG